MVAHSEDVVSQEYQIQSNNNSELQTAARQYPLESKINHYIKNVDDNIPSSKIISTNMYNTNGSLKRKQSPKKNTKLKKGSYLNP